MHKVLLNMHDQLFSKARGLKFNLRLHRRHYSVCGSCDDQAIWQKIHTYIFTFSKQAFNVNKIFFCNHS